jgi:hypothetical protein
VARLPDARASLTRAQRALAWGLAVAYGAFLPLTIVRANSPVGPAWWAQYLPRALACGAAVLVLSRSVLSAPVRAASPERRRGLATFATYLAPPLLVFVLYWVAYFPALMSDDSYIQWRQVVTGQFNAFLPLALTLFYWLLAHVWRSPAMLTLGQAFLLAAAFAHAMAVLDRAGAPRRLLLALTIAFALFPLNGVYAVTIWKDILYNAAILWLTATAFVIVQSSGRALERWQTVAQLALGLAAVTLLRPNGPVPAFATALALLVSRSRRWPALLGAATLALTLIVGVQLGLTRATGETFDGWGFYSASPFIWDVGAVLSEEAAPLPPDGSFTCEDQIPVRKGHKPPRRHGTRRVTADARTSLALFDDVNEWGRIYTAHTFPYWRTRCAHWARLDLPGERDRFMATWLSLAKRNPWTILQHRINAARIGWIVDSDNYRASVRAERAISPKGTVIPSPWPALGRLADRVVRATLDNPRTHWLTAHPAPPTYVALLFLSLFAIRRRSPGSVAVLVPLASNWATTMAFCMAQDVRYFYAAFLIVPFAVALPWTTPEPAGGVQN